MLEKKVEHAHLCQSNLPLKRGRRGSGSDGGYLLLQTAGHRSQQTRRRLPWTWRLEKDKHGLFFLNGERRAAVGVFARGGRKSLTVPTSYEAKMSCSSSKCPLGESKTTFSPHARSAIEYRDDTLKENSDETQIDFIRILRCRSYRDVGSRSCPTSS